MLQYEYINNNDDFKDNNYLNYFSKFSQIKEQANKSLSNLISFKFFFQISTAPLIDNLSLSQLGCCSQIFFLALY